MSTHTPASILCLLSYSLSVFLCTLSNIGTFMNSNLHDADYGWFLNYLDVYGQLPQIHVQNY